jgi:hypothetical protein
VLPSLITYSLISPFDRYKIRSWVGKPAPPPVHRMASALAGAPVVPTRAPWADKKGGGRNDGWETPKRR